MSIYDYSYTDIGGKEVSMSDYAGRVLLIVNTASKCGFTPQYKGLEALYKEYAERGLVVIGFPCDQFGHQEPGDEAAISEFCEVRFGVTFPLSRKIEVNGENAHPLYKFLKSQRGGTLGDNIKWNFTKFLVDREGNVVVRYASTTTPEKIASVIEKFI